MARKKVAAICVFLASAIAATFFISTHHVYAASTPTIKNIDHVPYTPATGEVVTVYATVYGDDINSVKLWSEQCSTICFLPEETPMVNIGGNEYKASVKLRDESINMTYWIEVESGGIKYKSDNITLYVGEVANNRPYCRIFKPKNGVVLSNTVTVNGVAGDPDGNNTLEKVEIKIDNGQWIKVSGTTSWSYQLDTTQFPNGQHTLYARAYDGEKYSGVEDDTYNRITFTVQNEEQPSENQAPTVSITYPIDGATVSGIVNITGTASDPDGSVTAVFVKIGDGNWVAANGTTAWYYIWDTLNFDNGKHVISAYAIDNRRKSSAVESVTINVNNPVNKQPQIDITYPRNGDTISGIVNITGTASDPNGDNTIDRVEIKLGNGNWQLATGTVNWYYIWDTSSIDYEEDFSISARVYDVNGSSSLKVIYVTVNNQGGNSRPTVAITSPEDGTIVTEKTIKIEGTASDPDGSISIVKIRIGGGEWKTASGTTSWSYNLDVSNLIKGPITIKVVAYDDKNLASQEATITLNIQYQPGKGNGTPGFEIIFMITAILVIILLRGRKNEY
ncbi:MAG TPA: hypothetical protein ENG38_00435 [Thermoplasmatales archaeon]|nr:hypothetical protein [Thermoplasmatales archaeon]HEX08259.1 hypothetical protein [Thermoplasmatales archaeon]